MSPGLLGTKTVDQIAFVVEDIEKASENFAELLGIPKPEWFLTGRHDHSQVFYKGEPSDTQSKLIFIDTASVQIELMEVNDEPSTMKDYLEAHGEGIHHIAFVIDKISNRIDSLNESGYELLQSGEFTSDNKGRYAYLDTEEECKTIIELLERETAQPKQVKDLIADPLFGSQTITQIALVVEDIDSAAEHYSRFLNMETPKKITEGPQDITKVEYKGTPTKADATFMFFQTPTIEIELIQPGKEPSAWKDHLTQYGEGVHHISFETDYLEDRLSAFEGYSVIQKGNFWNGNGRYAYLDTQDDFKVIIELLERSN
ncbi:VOC family protein [Alteribacillus bidgolensis]|uniref:Glyoxalase/Bleomycin resistance protein/Dioxygenase superfamily protein n=1 Tax=Alteribacillus bidgolensis TaxID=930129 RepID=A0A1G8FRF4_9BACI|nr:VOC family protein [Alteribacillus bidgolensis]SDH84516.1 Glyoxalase/Bleomycin resistance protein/Dioxygenase superfamily protein [Alteribacillus bidgolensis]